MTLEKKSIRAAAAAFVAVIVGVTIYGPFLTRLCQDVLNRQGSSHGIFVPIISMYFLWNKKETLIKAKIGYDFPGIFLMILGIIMRFAFDASFQLVIIAYIVFLSGVIDCVMGREYFKETSFPIFFLVTLIPLPEQTYIHFAEFIRQITLGGAVWVTSMTGIPFVREGIMVQLPNALLKVNIGCSGVRYFISFFVFGLAYAYVYRTGFWGRISTILATIPISFGASVCRLTSIFLLTYFFGPHMAEYWPHVIISWTVFCIVLFLSISIDAKVSARL